MIYNDFDQMVAMNAIEEVRLVFGTEVIELSMNQIGLFEIKGISMEVLKMAGSSGAILSADAAFIEIHRNSVAEIEFILQVCRNNGNGLAKIEVDLDNRWFNESFSVNLAWNHFHSYRVTSAGDLRLYIGTDEGWNCDKTYETSPMVMFGKVYNGVYDYSQGKFYEQGEEPKNHEEIVDKRQVELIKTLRDIRQVFRLKNKGGYAKQQEKLIILASILELHLVKTEGKSKGLRIAEYSFYDDVMGCYRNHRIEMVYDKVLADESNIKASKWHKDIVNLQSKVNKTARGDLLMLYNLIIEAMTDDRDSMEWVWNIYRS